MSMELDNSFTVPVPPEVAWDVLLDVARIAPCMPGATVDEVDGDVVTGRIKIKVGPVQLTYRGTAKFQDRDAAARTVLVEASGKETRGAGTAAATIKASLAPADDGATLVNMHTTMNVTGRPAQFGRGVMVEVGGKLVDKFAENLAQQLSADAAAPAAADTADTADTAAEPGVTDTPAGDAEAAGGAAAATASPQTAAAPAAPAAPAREDSLNIVRLVGPALLKRVVPVAAIAAALALAGRKLRRSIRRGGKD
ncbi:MAG TPA: SRPBCC family protein [Streptosporangiaceae bacterium]|nr:SRPBCC family protein [Streptosporangiaceae bacterium]